MFDIIEGSPDAFAAIKGNSDNPQLYGIVNFYKVHGGSIVVAQIFGLPNDSFFGFHIHSGENCSDNFEHTGSHFNPQGKEHPFHAGDMPPLLGNNGTAWSAFYTARFSPIDVSGKTVVIHGMPDDFRTQPSGDSGMKIACGVIMPCINRIHR